MADGTDVSQGNGQQPPKRKRGRPRKVIQVPISDPQSAVAKIDERVQQYAADFDLTTLTTADWQNIRNLVALEIASDAINNQLTTHATGEAPLTPTEIKALADSVKVFMAEARQQAAALGIDRKTRLSGEQSDLEEYLPKLAAEAKQFLYEHAIAIVCLECRKSQAQVDIRTGVLLYHFFEEDKELSATFRCQREACGALFTVNHENWRDYRMATVDAVQSDVVEKDKESDED